MRRLQWLIRRLKRASFHELVLRLWRALRAPLWSWLGRPKKKLDIRTTLMDGTWKEAHAACFPTGKDQARIQAEPLLANRLMLFSETMDFSATVNWHRHPLAGQWPLTPSWRMDYRHNTAGDPKLVWELNRLQFLPLLGKAYVLTGNEAYAIKAAEFIESWLDANPPFVGINWTSGIEMTLREFSWLWTVRFLDGSPGLRPELKERLASAMEWQARYLENHLSLGSSANNHLVAELCGLAVLGSVCGNDVRISNAVRMLDNIVESQIIADGVGAEQSTNYLCHTLEYYLITELELRRGGNGLSARTLARLARSAAYLQAMLMADGKLAGWGDSDSGIVLELGSNYPIGKSLLNLLHAVTGVACRQDDANLDEKAFWLLGPKAFGALCDTPSQIAVRTESFPEGGYYILHGDLKGKPAVVVFDCGPLGLEPLAAHGHADALSVTFTLDGHPVLVDPGTYTYMGDHFWRDYFRGTSAHNTLRLDGADQSQFVGPFLVGSQAKAACLYWQEGKEVKGRHDGYRRLPSPAMHLRCVSLDEREGNIVIEDEIETLGEHLVELFFHFDRSCVLRILEANMIEVDAGCYCLKLHVDDRCETSIYYGDEAFPQGWQSFTYGEKHAIYTVMARCRIKGSTKIITRLGA